MNSDVTEIWETGPGDLLPDPRPPLPPPSIYQLPPTTTEPSASNQPSTKGQMEISRYHQASVPSS